MRLYKKTISILLLVLFLSVPLVGVLAQQLTPEEQNEIIEQLKANLIVLDKKFQTAMILLDSSGITITNLQKQVADGQESLVQLNKLLEDKRIFIEDLQQQLAASKGDYQVFSQELVNWQQTINKLSQSLAEAQNSYNKALFSFNAYKEAVDKQIDDLTMQRNIAVIVA